MKHSGEAEREEEERGRGGERGRLSGSHTVLGCCSSDRQNSCMGRLDTDSTDGATEEERNGWDLSSMSPERRYVIR